VAITTLKRGMESGMHVEKYNEGGGRGEPSVNQGIAR